MGTAFVVQNNAYDAWGYEIKPLRYSLNGALADRYTWQGKEDLELDGLDNWSNFGWRIEDRAVGRWFTPDPEDQFESVSSYALCVNNPVSHIDPDGRVLPVFVIGAIIGALTSTASQVIQNKGFNNWNWGNFAIGTVTGAIGGGIADALPSFLGQSAATSLGGNIANGALNGAISGGIAGGISSALSGGNFWNGALGGAIAGGIGGGIGGLIEGNPLANALNDAPKLAQTVPPPTVFGGALDEVIVWGSRAAAGVEAGAASIGAAIGVGLYGVWQLSKSAANSGRGTSFMMDGHPSQYDLQKMLNEHYRKMAKEGKFKGGKQSQRDADFGIKEKDFWSWWHKSPAGKKAYGAGQKGQALPKGDIEEAFEDWVELGKPKK